MLGDAGALMAGCFHSKGMAQGSNMTLHMRAAGKQLKPARLIVLCKLIILRKITYPIAQSCHMNSVELTAVRPLGSISNDEKVRTALSTLHILEVSASARHLLAHMLHLHRIAAARAFFSTTTSVEIGEPRTEGNHDG